MRCLRLAEGGPERRLLRIALLPVSLTGTWTVEFIEGGPALPPPFQTDTLGSWTEQGDASGQFAGTAHYALTFDAPPGAVEEWRLDLGRVCESARVSLNGVSVGVLIAPPFQISVGPLRARNNVLEVKVLDDLPEVPASDGLSPERK